MGSAKRRYLIWVLLLLWSMSLFCGATYESLRYRWSLGVGGGVIRLGTGSLMFVGDPLQLGGLRCRVHLPDSLAALGFEAPICEKHDWGSWEIIVPLWLPCLVLGGLRTAAWLHVRQTRPDPVCGTCGYCLTGNVSGRCPECGTRVGRRTRERAVTSGSQWRADQEERP